MIPRMTTHTTIELVRRLHELDDVIAVAVEELHRIVEELQHRAIRQGGMPVDVPRLMSDSALRESVATAKRYRQAETDRAKSAPL